MALVFTHAFRWWVRQRPHHPAIVVEDEAVTYAELDRWSNAVAAWAMNRHYVRAGTVACIAGDNSIEWCIAALALMKIGAIIAPANTRYPPAELEYFIGNTSPGIILADDAQLEKLRAVRGGSAEQNVVLLNTVNGLRSGTHEPVLADVTPSDPAMILYTSGTTGKPKGIVHTNEMIMLAMFEGLLTEPAASDDTSMLLTLPMFTSAGIYNGFTRMLGRGGTLVVMRHFEARRAMKLIMRHRIHQFGGTPVVWEQMARLLPELGSHDFSHLRFAVCGGARLPADIIATFTARGIYIREAYGITEAGGAVSYPSTADIAEHPGTCGVGSIFTELRTVRSDGTRCAPDEIGEILIRGPYVMREYWRNPEKTAAAFSDGWLRSGDLGSLDESGRIRFTDRISNLIRSGNQKISPNRIEMVLDRIPGVTEIAVIGVPDTGLGQRAAAIIHSETGDVSEAVVLEEARRHLEEDHVPSYIVFSAAHLPRLASGKLDRSSMRQAYADLSCRQKPIVHPG